MIIPEIIYFATPINATHTSPTICNPSYVPSLAKDIATLSSTKFGLLKRDFFFKFL